MHLRLVTCLLAAPLFLGQPNFADVPDYVDPIGAAAGSDFLDRLARAGDGFDPSCERFLSLAQSARAFGKRLKTYPELSGQAARARFAIQEPDLMLFAIQTSLAEALRTSRELSRRLISSTDDPASQFYDAIFIGAGSAELTAQLTLRKLGRNFKTLTIEADEAVARTFWSTRAFYLNSTDGQSDADARPLPKMGLNLNKIPGGYVETSNIKGSGKYSSAGALGDILNVNRFLVNAPILFGERVVSYRPTSASRQKLGYPRSTVTLASGREVYANFVFEGTGLGTERSSASSAEGRAFVESEWDNYVNLGITPRYFSSIRLYNFVTHSRTPYVPFVKKEVLVVGNGDFARTIWELLERTGPPECYRDDSPAVGRSAPGLWLAQGIFATCEEFVALSRGRYYLAIPTALRNGRIKTINGRSLDVTPLPNGRVRVTVLGPDNKISQIETDIVVDSIGFAPDKLNTSPMTDVEAELQVTGRAIVGREAYPGAYVFGVASGVPVDPSELFNIDDNRASLYLNLVRVEALINKVLGEYEPNPMYTPTPARPRTRIDVADKLTYVQVDLVNPDGFVQDRDFAPEFANAQVETSLRELKLPRQAAVSVEIHGKRIDGATRFQITGRLHDRPLAAGAVKRLTQSLTATPAFLSVLDDRLDAGPTIFKWDFKATGETLDFKFAATPGFADAEPFERRLLKGFRPPTALKYQDPPTTPALAAAAAVPRERVTALNAPSRSPAKDSPEFVRLIDQARARIDERLPGARIDGTSALNRKFPDPGKAEFFLTVIPFERAPFAWRLRFEFLNDRLVDVQRVDRVRSTEISLLQQTFSKRPLTTKIDRVTWEDFGWLVSGRPSRGAIEPDRTRTYRVVPSADGPRVTEADSADASASPGAPDAPGVNRSELISQIASGAVLSRLPKAVVAVSRTESAGRGDGEVEVSVGPFPDRDWIWRLKLKIRAGVVTRIDRNDSLTADESARIGNAVRESAGRGQLIRDVRWDDFGWVVRTFGTDTFRVIEVPGEGLRVSPLNASAPKLTKRQERALARKATLRIRAQDEVTTRLGKVRIDSVLTDATPAPGAKGRPPVEVVITPFADAKFTWTLTATLNEKQKITFQRTDRPSAAERAFVERILVTSGQNFGTVTGVVWDDFGWIVPTIDFVEIDGIVNKIKKTFIIQPPLMNPAVEILKDDTSVGPFKIPTAPPRSEPMVKAIAQTYLASRTTSAIEWLTPFNSRGDRIAVRYRPFKNQDWVWTLTLLINKDNVTKVIRTDDVNSSERDFVQRLVRRAKGDNFEISRVTWDDFGWIVQTPTGARYRAKLDDDGSRLGELTEILDPPSFDEASAYRTAEAFILAKQEDADTRIDLIAFDRVTSGDPSSARVFAYVKSVSNAGQTNIAYVRVTLVEGQPVNIKDLPPADGTRRSLRRGTAAPPNPTDNPPASVLTFERSTRTAREAIAQRLPDVAFTDSRRVLSPSQKSDVLTLEFDVVPYPGANFTWILRVDLRADRVVKIVRWNEVAVAEAAQVRAQILNDQPGVQINRVRWDDFGWTARIVREGAERRYRVSPPLTQTTPPRKAPGLADIARAYGEARLPTLQIFGGIIGEEPNQIEQLILPFPDQPWKWRVRYTIEDQRVIKTELVYGLTADQELIARSAVEAKIGPSAKRAEVTWDDFGWAVETDQGRRFRVVRQPDQTYRVTEPIPTGDAEVIANIEKVFADLLDRRIPGSYVQSVQPLGANVVKARIRPRRDGYEVWDVAALIQNGNLRWIVRLDPIGTEEEDDVRNEIVRITGASDPIKYLTWLNMTWTVRKGSGRTFRLEYIPNGFQIIDLMEITYPYRLGLDPYVEIATTFALGKLAGERLVRGPQLQSVRDSSTGIEVILRLTLEQPNAIDREVFYKITLVDLKPTAITEVERPTAGERR